MIAKIKENATHINYKKLTLKGKEEEQQGREDVCDKLYLLLIQISSNCSSKKKKPSN